MIPAVFSTAIFLISLILIFSEKFNRMIAAVMGAALMLGVGLALNFYTEAMAIDAIDFNTLGLLLGMMILVSMLEATGFFQYLAVLAAKFSRGRPVRLLVLLGLVTTVLTMFLDNVTTVVLIAPVTILISEVLGINPIPLLMSEALLSDTGGVATLVGDPPNVLIASAANLSFNDFLTHAFPVVLVVWLVTLLFLRYLFRSELDVPAHNTQAVMQLKPEEALEDRRTAYRVLIVLGGAMLMFFVHKLLRISPAVVALAAAAAALVWVRPDPKQVLERVEWSVLIFFSALFIMVGGLEAAGVLHRVAELIEGFSRVQPVLFGLMLMWIVAGLSAVVDNVPITMILIPVILELGEAGVPLGPLWWAMAFGAGFGGNGTIIGSTANMIVVSLSERTRTPITATLWNRRGLPVMLLTLAVTSVIFVIAYPLYL